MVENIHAARARGLLGHIHLHFILLRGTVTVARAVGLQRRHRWFTKFFGSLSDRCVTRHRGSGRCRNMKTTTIAGFIIRIYSTAGAKTYLLRVR